MSGKPQKISVPPLEDDIPEALRDIPDASQKTRVKPILLASVSVGLAVIALMAGIWLPRPASQQSNGSLSEGQTQSNSSSKATPSDTLLGHFAYEEAPQSELESITVDGRLRMRKAAAKQFNAMVSAARSSGVIIVPISGFRSVSEQQHIFFGVKAQRGQAAKKRAEVSAPPGYSEHHTGYAVDLGDGNVPATNLSPNFENTAAFKWLEKNAGYYSFELSFPRNNSQGVSYEPWHWRYVGDQHSLETFYKAKNSIPKSQDSAVSSPSPSSPSP